MDAKLKWKFIFVIFAIIKHLMELPFYYLKIPINHSLLRLAIFTIPSLLCLLATLPFILVTLAIFWSYKQVAHNLLKLTLGDKYIELITGCDVITLLCEVKEPAVVTSVILLDSDLNGEEFFAAIKQRVVQKIFGSCDYEKLLSSNGRFMNYFYLRREDFAVEEIVRKFEFDKGEISEGDLNGIINENCRADLPRRRGNFDVLVATAPMENFARSKIKQFPILIRFHHCLGDGLSIYNVLNELFCEEDVARTIYARKFVGSSRPKRKIRVYDPNIQTLIPTAPKNCLLSSEGGDVITSFFGESHEECFHQIKKIKRRLPKTSFYSVFLAAYSASLAEFYLKNAKQVPSKIYSGMPKQVNMERIAKSFGLCKETRFQNDFSMACFFLPIVPREKRDLPIADYLMDRVYFIQDQFDVLENSVDLLVNYVLMKVFVEVTPSSLCRLAMKLGRVPTGVSCIPGGPAINSFMGHKIRKMFFYFPQQTYYGLGLSLLTYDNRLQLGLKANADCQTAEDLQDIMKDVFKYIKLLDEKTKHLRER